MGLIFDSDFHDEFATRAIGYVPYGGADLGEIQAVAGNVGAGDDSVFHEAWTAAADGLAAEADNARAAGHESSARALYLRASCFYAISLLPIYGEPVDPRLSSAFAQQIAAFNKGLSLGEPPVEPLRIPFEDTTLPAYLIPAVGREKDMRPLIVFSNGYDATITDMYFGSAVAAARRGYHSLIFDGPGQGEMLIEHGLRLRPDWETVVGAVVDFALSQPIVDPDRIALSGWSLGGHLAPRAASGEPRLAACVADPGLWGIAAAFRGFVIKMGATPEAAANLGQLDQAVLDQIWSAVTRNRQLRWTFVQRGFWVHGVDNLRDYLRAIEQFTMDGRGETIRCPALIIAGENDPLAITAQSLFDALRCRKDMIRFTAAEGAGDHCEIRNRSMLNRRVLDWLDDVLGVS